MSRPVRLPGSPRYAGDRYGRTGDPAKLAQNAPSKGRSKASKSSSKGSKKPSSWAQMSAQLEEPVACIGGCDRMTHYVVQLQRGMEPPIGPMCPKCATRRKGSRLQGNDFLGHAQADRT